MRSTESKELEESYQLCKSLVPVKPYPTLEGFKTVFAELAEKVPAARTANPKNFVDTRFLEEFDRSGFVQIENLDDQAAHEQVKRNTSRFPADFMF